jgi:nicotinate-nucleotide adenylyltransferase
MAGVGIMGGTFDPIHYGHLFAAEEARDELALEKIVFIPTGTPPHKTYKGMAAARDRYEMTLLAIAGNDGFDISKIETDRPGMSYTLDTLKAMRDLYPSRGLFFITGMDAVLDIVKWRAPFEISRLCTIVVVKRPGYGNDELEKLPGEIKNSLRVIGAPMLDISATEIRRRVREGRGVRYLMPEAVRAHIRKKNLYTSLGGESD